MPTNDPKQKTDDIPAESCSPAGPQGELPKNVYIQGDTVLAAEATVPPQGGEVAEYDATARRVCDDMYLCMTKHRRRLPWATGRMHSMIAIAAQVEINKEPVDLPQNHQQVPGAGVELADLVDSDPEARRELSIDSTELRTHLSANDFLTSLHKETAWLPTAISNNLTHRLNAIDSIVRESTKGKLQRLEKNPRLLGKLQRTWQLLTGPSKKGQDSRRDNERRVNNAVAEERSKHPAPAPLPTDPAKKP